MNQTIIFKGKEIHPYESFYHDVTENFNRGELGGVSQDVLKQQQA